MSNPYQPPAGAGQAPARRGLVFAIVLVGIACAVLAALIPALVLPSFSHVYTSFGADLPWLTRLVLQLYPFLWLCPVVVAVLGVATRNRPRGAVLACAMGVGTLLLVMPVTMLAAYWPIMQLGAVV